MLVSAAGLKIHLIVVDVVLLGSDDFLILDSAFLQGQIAKVVVSRAVLIEQLLVLIFTGGLVLVEIDDLLFVVVRERVVVCVLLFVAGVTLSLSARRIAFDLVMLGLNYDWLLLLLLQRVHDCGRPLLRSVLALADATFRASGMVRFASVAGRAHIAFVGPRSLTLITSETASQVVGRGGRGRLVHARAVNFLLGRRIAASVVTASNFVLFFYDGPLGLVVKGREEILSIVRRQFLPYEERLTAVLPGVRIGIHHALLDVGVDDLGITVENSIKRVKSN